MEKRLDIEIGLESFHILFKKSDHRLFAITKKELIDYLTGSSEAGCRVEVITYSHHRKFIWSPYDTDRFRNLFSIIYSRFPTNGQSKESVEFSLRVLQHINPKEGPMNHISSRVDKPQALIFSRIESNLYFFDTKTNIAFFFIKKETGRLHRLIGFLKRPRKREYHMVIGVMNGLMFVLSHQLISHGGLLLHGAAAQKDDYTVLFLGSSGAGKSTIIHLCRPDACFSDDGVIVRKEGDQINTYRSPFRQIRRKEKCPDCMKGKVSKLFLLEKDQYYKIVSMKKNELMHIIILNLIHFFKYINDETAIKGFSVVKEMVDVLPAYKLHFPKTQQKWDEIWRSEKDRQTINPKSCI
ncbi:MAG: hypothetical protein ACMUIU_05485 [bacterium]